MDSPSLDRARHLEALEALGRINAVSLASGRVWAEILRVARSARDPVRVLDVACGGGDVLLELARRASRAGVSVDLHGCDRSPVALGRARARGGEALDIRFSQMDVLAGPLPSGHDVVCSSLFLHHLTRAQAVDLLGAMAGATDRVLLVQDLRRTRLGYFFARLGLGVLTRSSVARHDGLVSVRAALTVAEAGALCSEAGLEGAEVRPCWPQRFTARWERA
jgi:SAM-dependent methyltransferase